MGVQVGLLVEAFVTSFEAAEERLFTSMDSQVSFKVKVERKLFATEFTLIRFFTLKISIKSILISKRLITNKLDR